MTIMIVNLWRLVNTNNIQSLIYRFIFEAMNNAVNYSCASHISFKVKKHAEGTALIYIDDGVGMYEEDGTLFLRSTSKPKD